MDFENKYIKNKDVFREKKLHKQIDENTFILNLQGDEPFLPKKLISDVVNDFFINECDVITASNEIKSNDEIGVAHSFVTFTDGSKQAVLVVYNIKDGKIIRSETGATNMPL